ncbi:MULTISPECIES: cytochrome P450 [Mycobacterium]|uniref:cytochrome P450 n=1 Tax=Mycobacterium TaxID=1763 RepID=UPI00351D0488
MTFRRTALRRFELSGVTIEPGDKVVMFYNSANRDPSVFAEPRRFDATRKPNPHLAFGGGGNRFRPAQSCATSAPGVRGRRTAILSRQSRGEAAAESHCGRTVSSSARHRDRRCA